MSCLLTLAARDPSAGFDVFTILGIVGIILGIIVLALRVASHGHIDCTRLPGPDRTAEPASSRADRETKCVAGE
jgi:hypothetical protein